MRLLIVSTAPFIYDDEGIYAYGPYVDELKVWNSMVSEIDFCCPVWSERRELLVSTLPFEIRRHYKLKEINLKSFRKGLKAFFYSIYTLIILFKAMRQADHIHLRCPGNIGLLGCLVQVLFPQKNKSAKYAGNWDPKSRQPWSYRLQKWILNNTFLTRNMRVLVYGEWEHQSENIKPFFTATYSEVEKTPLPSKSLEEPVRFVFVGSLVLGKNPLYAIQLTECLLKQNKRVTLNLYGEGNQKESLEKYIVDNKLDKSVFLQGNQDSDTLKKAYQKSHFVILASKSEGWPKAIAEGMFWGCVPLATSVSCVPDMLDHGNRGILLKMDLENDTEQVKNLINNPLAFERLSKEASEWSRQYTIEVFAMEIEKMISDETSFKN